MPPTGQLVCPAHPMQKPHLRAGMMFVSSAIAELSSSSDTTTKSAVAVMKRGGSAIDGAGHCMATAGRDVAMNADAHASMATTRTRTFFNIGGGAAVSTDARSSPKIAGRNAAPGDYQRTPIQPKLV